MSVGFVYRSVEMLPSFTKMLMYKNTTDLYDHLAVNVIVGFKWLILSKKTSNDPHHVAIS